MAGNELISMAGQFSGLPMEDLIGGPLQAAAKANSMMALTQTNFMLDTCFKRELIKGGEGAKEEYNYKPIMIKMELQRGVITPAQPADNTQEPPIEAKEADIQQVITSFELPILTIIPLNSLAVESVDIGFEMEVKSSFSEATSEATKESMAASGSFKAKMGYGCFSASVKGSVSSSKDSSSSKDTHYDKSNSAKYTINVHAGQLPLPTGVTTIINAFTKSIEPIVMPTDGKTDSETA